MAPISLISGPTPAALSDAFANPTASAIYALGGVWNGTTWDRQKEGAVAGSSLTDVADRSGRLLGHVTVDSLPNVGQSGAPWSVTGTVTPSDVFANPTTANVALALGGVWNGATWDRAVSANAANGTTGTGVRSAGQMVFDGTNWQRAGGVVGDTGQNATLVAGTRKEVAYTTGTNGALASTDASNYRSVSVQVGTIGGSATVNFEGSNDNATWVPVPLQSNSNYSNAGQSSTTATGVFSGPVITRYFRIRTSGQVSGTTSGNVQFFSVPTSPYTMGVTAVLLATGASGDGSGSSQVPNFLFNGASWDRARTVAVGDATGTGLQGEGLYVYNGTNWDRGRSATAAAATTGTGLQGVGALGIYNTTPGAVSNGNYERLQLDDHASLRAAPNASTSGGGTPYKLNSAATTNATSVKGSAGTLYSISAFNINAAQRYLKLYDKATAPTVGSDTPIHTILLPGNTAGAGVTINLPTGMAFANGIGFALTTGPTDGDTVAVAANDITVNLVYK